VKQALEQALQSAVDILLQDIPDAKKVAVKLSRPKIKEHGDYAANVAMPLAGMLKKNPRQVAELLLQAVQWPEQVEKTDVAGPGFINTRHYRRSRLRARPADRRARSRSNRDRSGKA